MDGGSLYVLHNDIFLRLSVGGPGPEEAKLDHSNSLAIALKRLCTQATGDKIVIINTGGCARLRLIDIKHCRGLPAGVPPHINPKLLFMKRSSYSVAGRVTIGALFMTIGLMLLIFTFSAGGARSAVPANGSLGPSGSPISWDGNATGSGAANGEATCVEGVNCDTFTLTVTGTQADWTNARIAVTIYWRIARTTTILSFTKIRMRRRRSIPRQPGRC